MYKVMLVDDFAPDRNALKELIKSIADMEFDLVSECENGADALEAMEVNKPDIIISDIQMPVMGGLELARNVIRLYPDIKIIFCSLYSEFEYVREALYLESYGYILKPFDMEELKTCIANVVNKISNEKIFRKQQYDLKNLLEKNMPLLVEDFVKSLVYGFNRNEEDIWEKAKYFGLDIKKGCFILSIIEIDDFDRITCNMDIEQKQLLMLKVFENVRKLLTLQDHITIARIDDFHIAVIFGFCKNESNGECIEAVDALCERILKGYEFSDLSVTIAVSDSTCNILELVHLLEQCNHIMRHKFMLGKSKIIRAEDIPYNISKPGIDYNSIQKEVRFLLNSGTAEEINSYLDHLFHAYNESVDQKCFKNMSFSIAICIQNVLYENNQSFQNIFNNENYIWDNMLVMETLDDIKSWIRQTFIYVNDYIRNSNNKKNKLIMETIKKYISDNYYEKLSLEKISSELFYSSNYLNYIFKMMSGETIFEYTCKFKVEKAKEMLADPGIKLYEIVDKLGYSHTAYFSSIFKKYTGITPKEYRERCI